MIVIGIDVGFAICGWSIVEKTTIGELKLIDCGVITTKSTEEISYRLKQVYEALNELIALFSPDCMSVEDLFFFKNEKTIIKVGMVRGVILLAGNKNNLPVYNYTPLQVKTAVTGYGRAEKAQVQKMVKLIFKLKEVPKPDDAADAVAIAVCHLNSIHYNELKLSK
ncbi:MAG: crossover junction endodeoxyribonuclease RuvC [Candidatus Dojkabacteria bacterium]